MEMRIVRIEKLVEMLCLAIEPNRIRLKHTEFKYVDVSKCQLMFDSSIDIVRHCDQLRTI